MATKTKKAVKKAARDMDNTELFEKVKAGKASMAERLELAERQIKSIIRRIDPDNQPWYLTGQKNKGY